MTVTTRWPGCGGRIGAEWELGFRCWLRFGRTLGVRCFVSVAEWYS